MLPSIAYIILIGMFLGWICKELRLPNSLGMVITGILLGPSMLNLIDPSILNKLFYYFELSIIELEQTLSNSNNSILKEGLQEAIELNNYLNKLGLTECRFTPYLARGLEIYTGTVWEVFDKQKRITSSIGAGGRYDKIITNFIDDGNTYPALGMTFGLVPIYEILTMNKDASKEKVYDL